MSIGDFAQGVRVGPGARLPRQPALYPSKRKWRLPGQEDATDYLSAADDEETAWQKNYSSVGPLAEKAEEVLEDQCSRGQVLKFTEQEAKARFPNLVVASLGALRKDKPGGVVTARVLFDGTKRDLREPQDAHPRSGTVTDRGGHQAIDAREIPERQKDPGTHGGRHGGAQASAHPPAGLAHARVPSEARGDGVRQHRRHLRSGVRILLLVAGRRSDRPCHAVL